ncbi:hypothetical protein DFH06DRAFT_1136868 [Mycena polygramma]|nr:hypothetical protein DFH06DRAFT_1136868 [Mycena polygramma]
MTGGLWRGDGRGLLARKRETLVLEERANRSALKGCQEHSTGSDEAASSEGVQSGKGWRRRQTGSVDAESTEVDGWSTQLNPDLPTRPRQTLPPQSAEVIRGKQSRPTGPRNTVKQRLMARARIERAVCRVFPSKYD